MDEAKANLDTGMQKAETRDENKSPTSGSSSEANVDEVPCKRETSNRKQRRNQKRKRKWKPYTELSWDEKQVKDDRESRRAFAKRERLSAEGHPIAPYNTTQFLMDDRMRKSNANSPADNNPTDCHGTGTNHNESNNCEITCKHIGDEGIHHCDKNEDSMLKLSSQKNDLDGVVMGHPDHDEKSNGPFESNKRLNERSDSSSNLNIFPYSVAKRKIDQRKFRGTDSPLAYDATKERSDGNAARHGEDIQNYIMDDFSLTYADIHAEHLQTMSKADLIEECLKLEKRVDTLEKRIKESKRKGKEESRSPEKIIRIQVPNAQLQKDNTPEVAAESTNASGPPLDGLQT